MPSLYGSTVNTGEVASGNFTTLYNSSGLAVPNAGAGSITGNLNVGGNLTVQGTSLLIGEVTLQSTLSLPNYTFPAPDGTTFQVLVTDGNGNLYWDDVSAIPGADYNISATTATGGANLTLANTAGFTDSVKFAAGTNMSIVRTDANTITIATVADNIPDGTARGQVLYWDGAAWTANNVISSAVSTNRLRLEYENSDPGANSAIFLRKNYGATAYTTNDGVAIGMQLDSNSQATNQIATIAAQWNASAPIISLNTNINNNTAGPFVSAASFTTTQATLPGDLAVNGGDITTTQTIGNLFNATATTVNVGNGATTEVNLGSTSAGRVQIKPNTIVGANTTQAVFNTIATTVNAFGASTATNIGAATGTTTIGNNLSLNGTELKINADGAGSPADGFIYFNGTNESLKWDQTNTRFELSDQLYISQTDIPQVLERRTTTAVTSPYELRTSQKLLTRVTDAPNNDTVITGPTHLFGRTSGPTDPTERLFASIGSSWDGAARTAELNFNYSNDNFSEPTPGNYPATYNLLQMSSNRSRFLNNSVYIDYSAQGTLRTATSITGGNTLVFPSAHSYTVGERIQYNSPTQNGLIQYTFYYVLAAGLTSTQCQLGLTSTGTAVVLTNGTSLSLQFADLVNQVGINGGNPNYTLDVNGTTNSVGQLSLPTMISNAVDPIYALRDTANTNISTRALTLLAQSSGTPTVGFGTTLEWQVETSTTNTERAGFINVVSTDVTPTSEDFRMEFGLMVAGQPYTNQAILDTTAFNIHGNTYTVNADKLDVTNGIVFGRVAPANNAVIRWNATSDDFEWSSGDGVFHDFIDATLTAPFYNGQLLSYLNGEWINDNRVTTTDVGERNVFEYRPLSPTAGVNTTLFLRKNYSDSAPGTPGIGTYADGAGVSLSFQVASDTQTPPGGTVGQANSYANITGVYSSTKPTVSLRTSINNGTNFTSVGDFTTTDAFITGQTLTLDTLNTGAANNSTIAANRGSSGADATIGWEEANNFWRMTNNLYVDNYVIGGVGLATNGNNIYFNNADAAAADCFITVKKPGVGDPQIKWNETTDRWQTSVDGSTYLNIPNQNLDTTDNVSFSSVTIDAKSNIDTYTATTTSTATTPLALTGRTAMSVLVTAVQGANTHVINATLLRNGATAMLTTYGEMYNTTPLATFTADISGANIRLLVTPTSATSTIFNAVRTSLD